ncbi:Hsp70 family protein [Actinoplanes sp. HUAS TT8]|uniref:Hsp70 family protein n=1 Tax=Actinoplanes sp. HUAS TT8 TaxID=3447453 RepID=UPI003F527685
MQFGAPRLAVDYGTACTRAVIAGSGGSWQALTIDGTLEPHNVAHVDVNGRITVGNAAWRQASVDPDGFVFAPLGEGTATITRHGREIEVSDLVAAMLRLVADEASAVLGELPADVRLTVPAGWGPRRRMWLRNAAHRAGLGLPTLVEAPVAAANRQLLTGGQLAVGAFVLVCDLGATTEASVLRRGPGGFEVLSTLFDADAGGQAIDQLLAGTLLVPATGSRNEPPPWPVLANVRTGKEAVSFEPAVTVPLPPPDPPVVISSGQVETTARPVLGRAADLCAAAVQAAELTTADLTAVYVVGAAATMPAAHAVLQERLAVPVQVVPMPGAAAVLGAADATGAQPGSAPVAQQMSPPSARELLGLLVPGVLSLVLFAHFVFSAQFSGSRVLHQAPWWVWANYGELAVACLFALAVCLAFGPWTGVMLARDQRLQGRWDAVGQVSAGMFTAVAVAGTVCALYALIASLYFLYPFGLPLRWALLPILPSALIAITVTVLLRKRPAVLNEGMPLLPVLLIGGGDLLFAYTISSGYLLWLSALHAIGTRAGVVMVGVGIAILLFRITLLRVVAAVTLGALGFFLADWRIANVVGVAVALAFAGWWAQRLWAQLR